MVWHKRRALSRLCKIAGFFNLGARRGNSDKVSCAACVRVWSLLWKEPAWPPTRAVPERTDVMPSECAAVQLLYGRRKNTRARHGALGLHQRYGEPHG